METSSLIRQKKLYSRNDKAYKIQSYGDGNDLPQNIDEIVNGSATGSASVETYSKFISGKGLVSKDLANLKINKKGHKLNTLVERCSADLAKFGGYAIHVIYNANLQPCEMYYCPFETVRLGMLDENGKMSNYALHWDWGKRFSQLRQWKKDDIEYINKYNPSNVKNEIIELEENDMSFDDYKGQLYYYSNAGSDTCYPLPKFNAALVDMSSEQGLSNITYRNARNNFLTAGMLVDINSEGANDKQTTSIEDDLMSFQGDEEACSIIYSSVKTKEEIPSFIPFKGENYDKDYTVSNELAKDKIGRSLIQPPILRAENVGAGFGADLMRNAYNFYNSITDRERSSVSLGIKDILSIWFMKIDLENTEIEPLSYDIEESLSEKLGENNMLKVMEIIDSDKQLRHKSRLLRVLFNISDDDIKELLDL